MSLFVTSRNSVCANCSDTSDSPQILIEYFDVFSFCLYHESISFPCLANHDICCYTLNYYPVEWFVLVSNEIPILRSLGKKSPLTNELST